MSKKLDGIKIANEIAESKGGKCLSNKYVDAHTKIKWQCSCGHRWESILDSIRYSNSWCPKCGIKSRTEKRKLSDGLQQAQEIAKCKDGKCLSTEYVNTKTKLKWQCKKGHQWESSLNSVKNCNTWCPECSYLQAAKSYKNSYTLYHWKTNEELVCTASYEKAVVEYLNTNNINFKWQPRSFTMPNGKRYHPDMYLYSTRKWIEIKGYFRDVAKIKWNWFQTIKPNSDCGPFFPDGRYV